MKITQSGPQTPGNTYNVKNWLKNKNVTDVFGKKAWNIILMKIT